MIIFESLITTKQDDVDQIVSQKGFSKKGNMMS